MNPLEPIWSTAPEHYTPPVCLGSDWDTWVPEPPHSVGRVRYATTADGQPLALLPRARVSLIFGPPGTGKSYLSAHLIAEVLAEGGTVALLDFEGSRSEIQGRLLSLGVDKVDAGRFWYWQGESLLGEGWDQDTDTVIPARIEYLKASLAALRPDLLVLDGMAAAMVASGLSESSNQEASGFDRRAVRPLLASAGEGCAMLLIGHVGKIGEGDTPMGPRGASSQLADVSGVSFRYSRVGAGFARSHDGAGLLRPTKDRTGHWSVDDAITFAVARDGDQLHTSLVFALKARDEQGRPVALMQQVSKYLDGIDGKAASKAQIERGVMGKAASVREAVDWLERAGHVAHVGRGPSSAYKLLAPFKLGLPYEGKQEFGDNARTGSFF